MIVLCDVDGVLADYVGGVLETVYELFGKQVFRQEIQSWDLFDHLGLEKQQIKQVYKELNRAGWCNSLDPMPGAADFVKQLQARGHSLKIVTSSWVSAPSWEFERRHWLKDHLKIPPNVVTFTAEKELIVGDVFIDDRTSHVRKWSIAHPYGKALLFSAPYNEREVGLHRVNNYAEALQAIDNFEEEVVRSAG
jgi:5'-nucleotidase